MKEVPVGGELCPWAVLVIGWTSCLVGGVVGKSDYWGVWDGVWEGDMAFFAFKGRAPWGS